MNSQNVYWNGIAKKLLNSKPNQLWRVYCDGIHSAWIKKKIQHCNVSSILKTDLFDEAMGGGLYIFLKQIATAVYGVDVSREILKAVLENHGNMKIINADVRNLPFEDNFFDVVISNSTLDHFPNRQEIAISLKEIHRVLKPEGRLLLTLDNIANPIIALRQLLPFRFLNRLGIVPYFVGSTLRPHQSHTLLRQIGFRVREPESLLHCPRVLAVVLASVIEKYGSLRSQECFVRILRKFEMFSSLPGRFLSGYFIAVEGVKEF